MGGADWHSYRINPNRGLARLSSIADHSADFRPMPDWPVSQSGDETRTTMIFRTTAKAAILSFGVWQAASAQPAQETHDRRAQMNDHEAIHAIGRSQAPPPRTRAMAKAKITVHSSEAKPFDQTSGPALMEVRISETFTGDIDGDSTVRALQVVRDDRSASLVSVQRFRGKLGGRQGSFVLQGSETVAAGKIKATWFVVPGSGTGDLAGLRGEGGFAGSFGKGSDGTLEYWFE